MEALPSGTSSAPSDNFNVLVKEECELIYQALMEPTGPKERVYKFALPILEIDGVVISEAMATFLVWNDVCTVHLRISAVSSRRSEIMSSIMMNVMDDRNNPCEYPWTTTTIESLILNMLDVINALRFDAYNTKFVSGTRKRRFWELYESENVKLAHGNCSCNCDELTMRKPLCGHYLCMKCNQRIKKQLNGTQTCPLCRGAIGFPMEESAQNNGYSYTPVRVNSPLV